MTDLDCCARPKWEPGIDDGAETWWRCANCKYQLTGVEYESAVLAEVERERLEEEMYKRGEETE